MVMFDIRPGIYTIEFVNGETLDRVEVTSVMFHHSQIVAIRLDDGLIINWANVMVMYPHKEG